jgi:hypothetical protein
MKVGDLVRCTWQPSVRGVVNNAAVPIEHTIKGELGIVIEINDPFRVAISFPSRGGYIHYLAKSAYEKLNENR